MKYARLIEAVEDYLRARPPVFRSKPVGAPHSQARAEQDAEIAAEDELKAALAACRS